MRYKGREALTGTIVVGVKESKEGTDSKHICVLVESHFERMEIRGKW